MPTNKLLGKPPVVDPDDAPELTAEFFDDAEHFKGDTFIRRGRGRPPTGRAKEQVSIRLDPDVLAKLREAGPGWQSRVNGMLRVALGLDRAEATGGGIDDLKQQVEYATRPENLDAFLSSDLARTVAEAYAAAGRKSAKGD